MKIRPWASVKRIIVHTVALFEVIFVDEGVEFVGSQERFRGAIRPVNR